MKPYEVQIDIDAFSDIKEIVDWYNKRIPNLGLRFQKTVKQQILKLNSRAYNYNLRYSNVRCMPVNKFPFMVHFIINELNKTVIVFAVIHTSRNPEIWEERNKPH
jgi:hypothetical protein